MVCVLACTVFFTGCNATDTESASGQTSTEQKDQSELFTDRDKEIGYDEENSAHITLEDSKSSSDSDAVTVEEDVITITDEGTYILSGKLTDGMVIVEAEKTDKIQIVLDGVSISSAESAAIYVRCADKVFVTTASETENTLSNGGAYTAIDENNIDAVIFSKDDLTLNGAGILTIDAQAGHGVVSKDTLILTSGTYEISAEKKGLAGKDCIGIAGGIIHIAKCSEGMEGLSIDIAGGDIDITASDDGLNAASSESSSSTNSDGEDTSNAKGGGEDIFEVQEGAYVHISDGTVHINASGDGIDSNGDLTISGGEITISGSENGANGALDYTGEGVITGGTLVAAGNSEMAQNLGDSSTQGVMMVTVDTQEGGSAISLKSDSGEEIVSWNADKTYSSVIVSCPEITKGETYTLTAGDSTQEITMDSLVYGSGSMGGGQPHGGTKPDQSEAPKEAPDNKSGQDRPEAPDRAGAEST